MDGLCAADQFCVDTKLAVQRPLLPLISPELQFGTMATIMERPRSASSRNSPALHTRPPVEIIDVDLLDEPTPSGSQRRSAAHALERQREWTFVLVDSDEEHDIPSQGWSLPSGEVLNEPADHLLNLSATRRPRLLSPPPPVSSGSNRIPPVPRVPRNYSALTSFPMRHRPPPVPAPPVVRPIDEPFDFEAHLGSPSRVAGPSHSHLHSSRNRRHTPADIRSEPRSHHVPALGLGGALISLNRTQADARLEQQMRNYAPDQTGLFGRAGHAFHRMVSFVSRTAFPEEDDDLHVPGLFAEDLGLRFDHPARAYALRELLLRKRESQMEYIAHFTHPGKPEPGFTYDFALPDAPPEVEPVNTPIVIDLEDEDTPEAGPSTGKIHDSPPPKFQTLLVCARCLDPLVLGAALVGEMEKKRRVWALRCGHMIDGKCLEIIGVPQTVVEDDEKPILIESTLSTPRTRQDSKGKGKARLVEEPLSPFVEENPMRSRLRSRVMSMPPPPTTTMAKVIPTLRTQLGKRKRTSLTSKSHIEDTYEWECPVPGCGHLHVSVKIDGVWVPQPRKPSGKGKGKESWAWDSGSGRGAIAVFV